MGGGDVSFTLNAVEQHGVAYAVDCRNGTENPFCERDSASEGAGAEPQQQQRCKSPEISGGSTPESQAVDVYNQTIDGEIAASVTAASGGTNTSGPKVLWGGSSQGNPLKQERSDTPLSKHLPSAPMKTMPSAGAIGIDHVLLSGGTTFQGRGWYDEVSGCLKTMPHGVMTDETDGS